MSLTSMPVFRKDLRVLLKPLLWFVALQGVYLTGVALVYWTMDWPHPGVHVREWATLTGWVFGQLLGFIAAACFRAEERASGTDVFLRRLPVSRVRIGAEKLAAGFTGLAALWALQVGVHLALLPWGGLWPQETMSILDRLPMPGSWTSNTTVAGLLALSYTSAYGVGLLVSLVVRQSIVIVLVGYVIWTTGFAVGDLLLSRGLFVTWEMIGRQVAMYAPLAAVPLVLALPGRRVRIFRIAFRPRTGMVALIWKSVTENAALAACAAVFLAATLVLPPSIEAFPLTAVGCVLITALGSTAYDPIEKRGRHCVLYQHPVPLGDLFRAKVIAGIAPVLMVSAGVWLYWRQVIPLPFSTALALVTFAWASSLLLTVALHRQVVAMLVSLCVLGVTTGLSSFWFDDLLPARGAVDTEHASALLWTAGLPFALLASGCLVAARRMVTDRAILFAREGASGWLRRSR